MTYRVRNIGIAVALAVLAALMISYYVTNYKRHVQHGASDVSVLVATKDIPLGTSGVEVAKQHMLRTISVSRTAVVPGAISNASELGSLVATQATYAGEQVSTRRFASQAAGGVRASITGPQRVMQIPGDANQLLAGTLKTGDHVDVVGSWTYPDSSSPLHVSRVVVRDLLVLHAPDTALDTHVTSGPNRTALGAAPGQRPAGAEALLDRPERLLVARAPPDDPRDRRGEGYRRRPRRCSATLPIWVRVPTRSRP